MASYDDYIESTKFSIQFILDKLQQSVNKKYHECDNGNVQSVKIRSLAGNGFWSYVNRISVKFHGVPEKFTAIFKVPTLGVVSSIENLDQNEMTTHLSNLISCHNQEVKFYQNISPFLQNHPILRKTIPKAYAHQLCDGQKLQDLEMCYILMEDLGIGGMKSIEIVENLEIKQVESTIETFASLHAVSATIPDDVLYSLAYDQEVDYKDRLQNFLYILIELPDFDYYFERNRKALASLLSYVGDIGFFSGHELFGMRPVVSHGDLWNTNLLYSEDGSLKGVIDWQFAHTNTGINDLANLFITCVDAEIRQAHQDSWLRQYYDNFSFELSRLGIFKCPIKDFAILKSIYDFHFPIQLVSAMMVIMKILQSKPLAPEERLRLVKRLVYGFDEIRGQFEKLDDNLGA